MPSVFTINIRPIRDRFRVCHSFKILSILLILFSQFRASVVFLSCPKYTPKVLTGSLVHFIFPSVSDNPFHLPSQTPNVLSLLSLGPAILPNDSISPKTLVIDSLSLTKIVVSSAS